MGKKKSVGSSTTFIIFWVYLYYVGKQSQNIYLLMSLNSWPQVNIKKSENYKKLDVTVLINEFIKYRDLSRI